MHTTYVPASRFAAAFLLAALVVSCSKADDALTPVEEGWAYLEALPGEVEALCDLYDAGEVEAAETRLRAATANALGEDAPEDWYGADYRRQAMAQLDEQCGE